MICANNFFNTESREPTENNAPVDLFLLKTSTELSHEFSITPLKGSWEMSIMSLRRDKLLMGHGKSRNKLFVCNLEGAHLLTIAVRHALRDAQWTHRGNIVYSTDIESVAVMSEAGKIMRKVEMKSPHLLSIFNEIIYLADGDLGLLQSKDEGVAWNVVFKPPDGWRCWHVIRVTADGNRDGYWTIEYKENDWRLRIYNLLKKHSSTLSWKDIDLSLPFNRRINVTNSKMSYDGSKTVLVTDSLNKTVHALSLDGQYKCELLPLALTPYSLAVDTTRLLLFIGLETNNVQVYSVIHEQ